MKATIELTFGSLQEAQQVKQSIDPDNTPLPSGITIDSRIIENTLRIEITCERGIDSFRGTIEDIMSAIDLSIRTIDVTD